MAETRKSNGEFYPPSTLHLLLCALLCHMRDINHSCPNFLDKQDSHFKKLHGVFDAYYHKLCADGIGVQVKHTEILTEDDDQNFGRVVLLVFQLLNHYKMLYFSLLERGISL